MNQEDDVEEEEDEDEEAVLEDLDEDAQREFQVKLWLFHAKPTYATFCVCLKIVQLFKLVVFGLTQFLIDH